MKSKHIKLFVEIACMEGKTATGWCERMGPKAQFGLTGEKRIARAFEFKETARLKAPRGRRM